jgi:hypothetical protein
MKITHFCQLVRSATGMPAPDLALAQPPAEDAVALWPAEHGHGLWLIRQEADQTSLHSCPGGTVATVSFTLPGRPG